MKQARYLWVAMALGVWFIAQAHAKELPRARPEELGFSTQKLAYIDEFYTAKVKQGEMAGIVVLVARHGKIAHLSAVGYADVERQRPMKTDTIFRLYSMTKPIASTALMMLYQEGRFQMRDPLSKYLPEFGALKVLRTPESPIDDTVPVKAQPTMQDVLRHTAGFSHGGGKNAVDAQYVKDDIFSVDITLEQMMTRLSKIPLLAQPGEKYIYSVAPDVQARLVEVLSGQPFDRFLEERLFRPLGMKDAGFWVTPDKIERFATVHWAKDGKLTPLDDARHPADDSFLLQPWSVNSYSVNHSRKGGSYGLVSTAEDYWRFAQAMLNGGVFENKRILSPMVVRYMARDHLGSIQMRTAAGQPEGTGFGLGFAVMQDSAVAGFVSSEGSFYWAGAAHTYFWIDPTEDLVVVAMTQHMSVPAIGVLRGQLSALVYSALIDPKSH